MITLSPKTVSVGQHLATVRMDSDQIIANLADIIGRLANAAAPVSAEARSSQANLRDIRSLITRVSDMSQQAYRELNRGDHDNARHTCEACTAILTNELPIRLRAWSHTEPNPDIRILLDDWIASLEQIQETVC